MRTKFLYLIASLMALIFVSSCDPAGIKDENKNDMSSEQTTYTINNQIDMSKFAPSYISVNVNIAVKEYNDKNECIDVKTIQNVTSNTRKTLTADPMAEKLTIYYEVKAEYNGEEKDTAMWLQQVFYLKQGSNITIDITDETRIGVSEPL